MVGGFSAFLEDVGHAKGVAHFDEPIAHRSREAVVEPVVTASFPRGDVLLFLFFFFFQHLVATDAKADLWPDAQSRDFGFVVVVFCPSAEIDVEQQRNVNVVRPLLISDGIVVFVKAFLGACALSRINHVDFASDEGMLRDEGDAHATSEIGAEPRAVVALDAHGAEGRS